MMFPTDWPPMVAAMQRMTARCVAIAGGPTDVRYFDGEHAALSAIRRVVSGTDIDPVAVSAMLDALSQHLLSPPHGVPAQHVVNGLLLDAFMVGFWTREAMPDAA